MEATQILIKSIPRQTATKISEFSNKSSGKKLNKNKIGKCKDTLRAFYSDKTGKLVTGLDKYVDNPYYKSKKDLVTEFEYVRNLERISLQELLEIKHNVSKGTYKNNAWRQGEGLKDEDLSFFQKFKYKMNDGTTILDLSKVEQELAYYMLKEHPLVAGSNKHEDKIKKPKAEYYIADINESVQEKYTKKFRYGEIIKKLHDKTFTPSYQAKVAKVLGLFKGDSSAIITENLYIMLDGYIEEGYKNKDKNLDEFESVYSLLSSADGRSELEALCFLADLVDSRLVSDTKGIYTWLAKGLVLGQRKAEAIDFLLDPKKQPEKDELKRQLEAKLKR